MSQIENENTQAKSAWERNAAFWDERMGEGNDFFDILLWPAVEKLLRPAPGERLLDIACGNGLTSRRLANAKTSVTAVDGSATMIALAHKRPARPISTTVSSMPPIARLSSAWVSALSTVRSATWPSWI